MRTMTIRIEEAPRVAYELLRMGCTFEAYQIDAVTVKFELLGY